MFKQYSSGICVVFLNICTWSDSAVAILNADHIHLCTGFPPPPEKFVIYEQTVSSSQY